MKNISTMLLLALCVPTHNILANNELFSPEGPSIYEKIAMHHLPALVTLPKMGLDGNRDDEAENDNLDYKGDDKSKKELKLKEISPGEQKKFALALLAKYGNERYRTKPKIFDESLWSYLNVLCGPAPNNSSFMSGIWEKEVTNIGKIVGKRILLCPTTDITTIKNRQAIIQEFSKERNRPLGKKIRQNLGIINKNEAVFWGLWTEESDLEKQAIDSLYPLGIRHEIKNHFLLGAFNRMDDFIRFWITLSYFGTLVSVSAAAALGICGLTLETWNPFVLLAIFPWVAATAGLGLPVANTTNSLWENKTIPFLLMQKRLMAIAEMVSAIKNVYKLAKQNTILKENIPQFKKIPKFLTQSEELYNLLNLLNTKTFEGKPSCFSNSGRVLAANQLLEKVKDLFIKSLEVIGEIDSYLSVAGVLKKSYRTGAQFCIAELVEQNTTPYLKLQNAWFPQDLYSKSASEIEKKSIEINPYDYDDITLKGSENKEIATALLLAQSYGVAPAEYMKFTPFSRVKILNKNINNILPLVLQASNNKEAGFYA